MHFKLSVIAVFAAMLTIGIAAPPPDPWDKFVYVQKSYPGEEKRSDPAKEYIYMFKDYPEEEKRGAA